jgi:hypothetical protein
MASTSEQTETAPETKAAKTANALQSVNSESIEANSLLEYRLLYSGRRC